MPDHDRIHVTHSLDPDQFAAILQLFTLNQSILQEIKNFMAALDDQITALQADVVADTTAVAGAVTLINGIAAQIAAAVAAAQAAGATPAQLQSLTDLGATLTANTNQLAAAVAANTPATPAIPVPKTVPAP